MTEDEAKTKWCPQSRFTFNIYGVPEVSNLSFEDDSAPCNTLCIASGCMWWVFDSVIGTEPDSKPVITTNGHCGAIK